MKDYYKILQISDDAEPEIIEMAYKTLAKKYHPDVFQGSQEEANKRMQDLNEAYDFFKKNYQYKNAYKTETQWDSNHDNFYEHQERNKYNKKKSIYILFFCIIIIVIVFALISYNSVMSKRHHPTTYILGNVNVGEYITFGHYEQDGNLANSGEPIEWKVLDKKDDRVLLVSKYCIDCKSYDESMGSNVTWENCALREWLNETFANDAFTDSERNAIQTVTISNSNNPVYGTNGGNDTEDTIFLLSLQEMQLYFQLSDIWTDYDEETHDLSGIAWFPGGSRDVITSPTAFTKSLGAYTNPNKHDLDGNEACWWWLRSPGGDEECAAAVNFFGLVDSMGDYANNGNWFGVRPAMWINYVS